MIGVITVHASPTPLAGSPPACDAAARPDTPPARRAAASSPARIDAAIDAAIAALRSARVSAALGNRHARDFALATARALLAPDLIRGNQ